MILLLIPALIWYFGGEIGRWYVLLGMVSLTLDWTVFYMPGFKHDREIARDLLRIPDGATSDELERLLSTTKWAIFHLQYQSLGWWVFTSWRWVRALDTDYRRTVGEYFLLTSLGCPLADIPQVVAQNRSRRAVQDMVASMMKEETK